MASQTQSATQSATQSFTAGHNVVWLAATAAIVVRQLHRVPATYRVWCAATATYLLLVEVIKERLLRRLGR